MGKIKKIRVQNWKDEYATPPEIVEYDMGMRVSEGDGKSKIELFALKGSEHAVPLDKSVYRLCSGIIDDHFPGKALTDFDWEYTISYGHTEINFIEQHGYIAGVQFSNGYPAIAQFSTISDIEQYEEILLERTQPLNGMTEREYNSYYREPLEKVIVPLPDHPEGHLIMDFEGYSRSEHYELVFLDAKKFMAFWIDQSLKESGCKSMDCLKKIYDDFPVKGDDSPYPPFHTTVQESIEHVKPHFGYPGKFPIAGYGRYEKVQKSKVDSLIEKWVYGYTNKLDEEISFTNGRHRTLNLYKTGAPFIPMAMNKNDDLVVFKQRFEWNGNDNASPDLEEHLVYQ